MGARLTVRVLSDGRILVNDPQHLRLMMFDASLRIAKTTQQFPREQASFALIPYTGDSTLYVDPASRTLVAIDGDGKVGRVMSLPVQQHAMAIGYAPYTGFGNPQRDPQGRLIYRVDAQQISTVSNGRFRIVTQPDSAPIVRADLDLRKLDTIAFVKVSQPPRQSISADAQGVPTLTMTAVTVQKLDEWTVLSDGTTAIVRADDYHIDWIAPNGTRRSTPRMQYDWVRLSDQAKQKMIDSIKTFAGAENFDSPKDATIVTTDGQSVKGKRITVFMSPSEMPDYDTALTIAQVYADRSDRLWILPRIIKGGGDGGLIYDVVSKEGKLLERVRLPKDRILVGFALDNSALLAHVGPPGAAILEQEKKP